jgi:tRNA A37 threonylcarbamoyltransferase TsaD
MEKRFGEAFTSLDPEMTGPGSRFMDQFEMAKRDFSLNQPKTRPHRLHLPMGSLQVTPESKKHYDSRFGYVLITHEDLKTLFDPVWSKVIGLVADQVNRVKKETSKGIDHLVLVGGFGSSPYIKERLKEWCLDQNIRMTTPWSGA